MVERDGLLLMVDDERLPLNPGERPLMRSIRFRTLGCYPLTGAVESAADHAAADHPGNAAHHDLRAAGSRDRPRSGRIDGEEEAGRAISDGSTSESSYRAPQLAADDIDAYLAEHQHKSPAALHHLRLRR